MSLTFAGSPAAIPAMPGVVGATVGLEKARVGGNCHTCTLSEWIVRVMKGADLQPITATKRGSSRPV